MYKGAICRGSIALGSGCRACEKCHAELEKLKADHNTPLQKKPASHVNYTNSQIIEGFYCDSMPLHLKKISEALGDVAKAYNELLPDNPDKNLGLQKLLEANFAFLHAAIG